MSTTVGGPPVNHNHTESINGRNATIPAVPSSAVNGNSHNRNPSMTVTPAGASFNAHGGPQSKTNNIQFGSMNAGSPAMSTPQLAHNASNSLGVNSLNPRAGSPQGSPSPIPQPASVSGGRPPSSLQGSGVSFGQIGPDSSDPSGLARPMSQMSYPPGQEHVRRSSSQSMHGEVGNNNLPTGPGRGGYPNQGGRGRGGYYQGQMAYSPHQNFRPAQMGRGVSPNYQGQNRHQLQYQGSPNLGTRSPMMNNANPGTPQMAQVHMMSGMQGQPNYYTTGPQGYGPPTAADPSISYMSNMNMNMYNMSQYGQVPGQYQQYGAPPQSPRPPYQQPGYGNQMQQSYSQQGPQSMSRQSSQMSATAERPGSSIGHAPHTPSVSAPHPAPRTPSMSTPKSEFTLPSKKPAKIVIKNAAGEVVDFKKSATPSTATPATSTPVVPTPPSRTGSAIDHTRAESSAKSDEEKKKAMQEAVAKKVAEEQAKVKQEKEAAEQKIQQDKEDAEQKAKQEKDAADAAEAAEVAKREAEEKKAADELAEKEAKEAEAKKAEEAKAAAESAKESAPVDDEPDFDAMEAEYAAMEAEEARREEEYQKKKAAEKEARRKKEQEEEAAYEATMKEMERKAEEEELAREKKKADGTSEDSEAKKIFANLKAGEGATPVSDADNDLAQTPVDDGAQTPTSDAGAMPPPKSTAGRRGKVADLTLDTKKSVEPPEPSATLKSLTSAKRLEDPTQISYPSGFASPNPALTAGAPAGSKFKYDKEFLLQFQSIFKEKPSLDWDSKIRESLGDGDSSARPNTARTPSNLGGRSASNRPSAASAFPQMGQFGAGGRQPVPAGTTSEQRFAASQAAMRGGPMANPFNMGRPGSMGPPTGRTPSNNPFGAIPGSPRPGGPSQRGQRNESKRNKGNHKQEAEQNKSMPLTAGMSIALPEVSTTGWKPRSIGQTNTAGPTPGGDGYLEPDVVQRKVKAALNKMTPEKFDKIADQILDIAAQSKHESDGRTLRQVIQLTFEKATDEAHWAPMYAMFCRKMLQSMSADIKDENIKDKNGEVVTGGNLFRKYLLNRCQEEFERGWKIDLPAPKEGESQEAAMLSDEYYIAAAAKRRGLGLVKFIGELFKLGMLTERIMHECVKKLVDYEGIPEEAEVESLTSLLRTIGKQLDSSESKAQGRMDVYFERIRQTMDLPDLPSRLHYMLLDIVDLRRNHWISKQDDKGPKTIQEIREEAEREAQKQEMNRLAQQANRGGGRMPMGRGDARSFSYGQAPPPDTSNRVGADDLRRLGGRNSRNPSSTGPSLGPPSMLAGRTNSNRRGLGPGSLLSRGEDSNASSRTGTPPAQKGGDKKDESSTNAFSALAALDNQEVHDDPSSPPAQKSQPNIERERSRSPEKSAE